MKNHTPERMCVACREKKPQNELLRIGFFEGNFNIGKGNGRGAYICKCEKCVDLARKKQALKRHFKTDIPDSFYDTIKENLTEKSLFS